MNESFLLPLSHNGEEWNLEAEFQPRGFSYVIQVTVGNQPVIFERDEENNFRAVFTNSNLSDLPKPDPAFLSSIAETLRELFS